MAVRKKRYVPPGGIDPARRRWVRTDSVEFVHYDIPPGDKEREGTEGRDPRMGRSHMFAFIYKRGKHSGKMFTIDLTEMTTEEIDKVKELIDVVFAEAKEVCEHRDQTVRKAFEDEGDHSSYRLYRAVPQLIERPRAEPEHTEGVPGGPDGVPGVGD